LSLEQPAHPAVLAVLPLAVLPLAVDDLDRRHVVLWGVLEHLLEARGQAAELHLAELAEGLLVDLRRPPRRRAPSWLWQHLDHDARRKRPIAITYG